MGGAAAMDTAHAAALAGAHGAADGIGHPHRDIVRGPPAVSWPNCQRGFNGAAVIDWTAPVPCWAVAGVSYWSIPKWLVSDNDDYNFS